jgi:hypothetical protein
MATHYDHFIVLIVTCDQSQTRVIRGFVLQVLEEEPIGADEV